MKYVPVRGLVTGNSKGELYDEEHLGTERRDTFGCGFVGRICCRHATRYGATSCL